MIIILIPSVYLTIIIIVLSVLQRTLTMQIFILSLVQGNISVFTRRYVCQYRKHWFKSILWDHSCIHTSVHLKSSLLTPMSDLGLFFISDVSIIFLNYQNISDFTL